MSIPPRANSGAFADTKGIWLRREVAPHERRTVIAPTEAGRLVGHGLRVTVEEADQRAFSIEDYAAVGCRIVPRDTWPDAPESDVVVGLKAPSTVVSHLRHRHVFFGHAYKGQTGAEELLCRFATGGGTLLDLENLVDPQGRRLVAFGFWAGYVGAALAVLAHRGTRGRPLDVWTRDELDEELRRSAARGTGSVRALVIGALGRSGRGACEALRTAGIAPIRWDVADTARIDRAQVAGCDLLVNTVATDAPGEPFVDTALASGPRRLRTISDVTCDVTSARNRLPVNTAVTTWADPVRRLHDGPPPLDVIAVDNLPSLLPTESSAAFSSGLIDLMLDIQSGSPVWRRCEQKFRAALAVLDERGEQ